MNLRRILLALPLALAVGALPAPAQSIGSSLPEVELDGYSQTEAKSFEDFHGRAVLIEFFAHWWKPCALSVPHLNELQELYGGKGLTIIGVTDESKSQTEPWVERHGARYAYAYDKGGKLARFFGVRGIPDSVLIDPAGKVVWRGHPGSLRKSDVERHLDGALTTPLYEWPSSARSAAQALVRGRLADALEKAASVPESDGGPEIVAQVRAFLEARVKALEASLAEGDFLGAQERGKQLAKGLAGLPEEARAEKVLAAIDADERAEPVMDAQKRIRKIRSKDPSKRREIESAIDDMRDIARSLPDTYAAKEATEYLEVLYELLRR